MRIHGVKQARLLACSGRIGGTSELAKAGSGAVDRLPEAVRRVAIAASVEPLRRAPSLDVEIYVRAQVDALRALVFDRQIAAVRSRVQRINPQDDPDGHQKAFAELLALEKHRRELRERVIGEN